MGVFIMACVGSCCMKYKQPTVMGGRQMNKVDLENTNDMKIHGVELELSSNVPGGNLKNNEYNIITNEK
jgi:hypothetical protein